MVETAAKRLRTRGDGKGDKDDKHGILGRGGTTLINTKAIDQSAHFKFLLAVGPGLSPVCAKGDFIATQPTSRLIQSLSVACQAVVRKAPFVIYFIR
jgi:hypothetical protein